MNKVLIVGRLGSDPKFHTFEDGGRSAQFSVATTEYWKDRNTGETKEETEWHRCVANGAIAERAERLKKGSLVAIEGRNRTREYTDSNGIDRSITQVIIAKLEIHDSANKGSASSSDERPTQPSKPARSRSQVPATAGTENENDDVPF